MKNKKLIYGLGAVGALLVVAVAVFAMNGAGSNLTGNLGNVGPISKQNNVPGYKDLTAPTVGIYNLKEDGGSIIMGKFTLSVIATDNVGVTKVEFYKGAKLEETKKFNETKSYVYNPSWDTSTQQNNVMQVLSIWAYDAAGNIGKKTMAYKVDNTITILPNDTAYKAGGKNLNILNFRLKAGTEPMVFSKAYNNILASWGINSGSLNNVIFQNCKLNFDGTMYNGVYTGSPKAGSQIDGPIFKINGTIPAQSSKDFKIFCDVVGTKSGDHLYGWLQRIELEDTYITWGNGGLYNSSSEIIVP